jgi:phosphatidylserine/phosphatidylglycerophosphate/cardiolipin synthase-like enzyme
MFRKLASGAQEAVGIGGNPAPATANSQASVNYGAVYYSPWQNLEGIEYNAIAHSRCNHLDIAAYAFTDLRLADAVAAFARSGRPVRIYRDREQYDEEQKRGSRVSNVLQIPNISIRVKSSTVLMHQKAWSDGCVLREGSANWSQSGERLQDNTLTFLNDSASVTNFERAFEAMWDRRDNIVVQ